MKALLGEKVGMTQVYSDDGTVHPVTVVKLGPCNVIQVKSKESDGYDALQLGYGVKRDKSSSKAEAGHAKKAGLKATPNDVREIRLEAPEEYNPGDEITCEIMDGVKKVDIVGTMKGRGFAGVMKRHGFGGLEATHGVQRKHRAAGSIGCSAYPARVIKGRKMNGQYGNTRVTIKNVKVAKLDSENHCILLEGSVPGPNGSLVLVKQALSEVQKMKKSQ